MQEELHNKWKSLMKEALHQAVVKILAEDGPQGLTMDRVTQEAGISKGTLYNYFKDKQELLQYVVQSSFEPMEQENEKIFVSDLTPPQKLEEFAVRTLSYFDKHRDFFRVLLDPELSGTRMHPERKNRHQKLISKVSVVFEEGIKGGYFRPGPPMKLAAMFVMSCASMTMGRLRLWTEDQGPIEDDARLVINVFFSGVAKGGKKK
jgi:AcrR family transcriptional regulator